MTRSARGRDVVVAGEQVPRIPLRLQCAQPGPHLRRVEHGRIRIRRRIREVRVRGEPSLRDRLELRPRGLALPVIEHAGEVEGDGHHEPGRRTRRERGRIVRDVTVGSAERAQEHDRAGMRAAERDQTVDQRVVELGEQAVHRQHRRHRIVDVMRHRAQRVRVRRARHLAAHALDRRDRLQHGLERSLVGARPDDREAGAGRSAGVHRRHVHVGDGQLARRGRQGVPHDAQQRGLVAVDRQLAGQDARERRRLEVEPRDDAEVAATAPDRPEQLGVLRGGGLDHPTVRGHHLRAAELVDRESAVAHEQADAAADGEAADPDARGVAGTDRHAVRGERRGHLAPERARADADQAAPLRLLADLYRREGADIDRECARRRLPEAVAAAADDHRPALLDRTAHGCRDLVGIGGVHDLGLVLGDGGSGFAGGAHGPTVIMATDISKLIGGS
ncbi:hypothetical protein MICRO8M_100409 [Microbacterium sp. 8M]|nr:hypothetical protein MICRO8M_100409 [Microbacterium sp. 8M]